jgi:glycerol kinase
MSDSDNVILAIDQGTTGSTVLILDQSMTILGRATTEFRQIYPKPGWVEHDPEDIWTSVKRSTEQVLTQTGISPKRIAAIGITNQRETTVIWDRATSQPIYNAIVWQCRRTSEVCAKLREAGLEDVVREKTGLVIDPYFSGTKVAWILDHVDGARARATIGELAFGTIDCYLLWRLTNGLVHATEVTNASRTQLFNIRSGRWDPELLDAINVPDKILPRVCSSSEIYGQTSGLDFLPDGIPISGMAGDQQAALFGQACFEAGQTKCTYGTGAFVLMNIGHTITTSTRGLLTTVAWRIGDQEMVYALEGSVFIAGAAVQWLRDELKIIESASAIEALARTVPDSGGVKVVSAFAGLGTPYWNADARGAIMGLTRGSNRAHIARATLEGMAHQVTDVLEAMEADTNHSVQDLRVDGGAAANDLLMQMQADLVDTRVTRPTHLETTAMGAAFLAGLGVGFWQNANEIRDRWQEAGTFKSQMSPESRISERRSWSQAVKRLL